MEVKKDVFLHLEIDVATRSIDYSANHCNTVTVF